MAKSAKAKKSAAVETKADDGKDKLGVKKALLSKAVKALAQIVQKKSANTNQLFGEASETMTVYFTLSSIPDRRRLKPVSIPLPHPMYDDKSEICFICRDPQKKYKELLMQKHPVPGITKVIGVDKLRRNYKTFDDKRKLADAFDLFLCDAAVMEMMPKLLGSIFLDRKLKRPIPVRLRAQPEENLKKAISSTPLRIPSGPCLGIKIGRVGENEDNLVANAAAVIVAVKRHLEQQDNYIQSISVKTTDSPSLPIWRRERPKGELLDLKKYHSDTASSAPSQSGRSGSATATSDSEIVSDAGETLSTRDTISELDTGNETLSELGSELDSEAGDIDEDEVVSKGSMPLMQGLKGKKRRRDGQASPQMAPKESPKGSPKKTTEVAPAKKVKAAGGDMMPPVQKKAKKGK